MRDRSIRNANEVPDEDHTLRFMTTLPRLFIKLSSLEERHHVHCSKYELEQVLCIYYAYIVSPYEVWTYSGKSLT